MISIQKIFPSGHCLTCQTQCFEVRTMLPDKDGKVYSANLHEGMFLKYFAYSAFLHILHFIYILQVLYSAYSAYIENIFPYTEEDDDQFVLLD